MTLSTTPERRDYRYLKCDQCKSVARHRINGHPKCTRHALPLLKRAHKEGWTVENIKEEKNG